MKKLDKKKEKRSRVVTIIAGILALGFLTLILLLLPLHNLVQIGLFVVGALIVLYCASISILGRIDDKFGLSFVLTFWS
jgi:hypothetical protein